MLLDIEISKRGPSVRWHAFEAGEVGRAKTGLYYMKVAAGESGINALLLLPFNETMIPTILDDILLEKVKATLVIDENLAPTTIYDKGE